MPTTPGLPRNASDWLRRLRRDMLTWPWSRRWSAQVNGKVPKAPIMPAATGFGAFLAAQAVGPGVDDGTLVEALGYAEQRGWTNGHAAPEDGEMVPATRQLIALLRRRTPQPAPAAAVRTK